MAVQTTYLDAIQSLPGHTPGEKFRWIANLIMRQLSLSNSLEDVVNLEKLPRILIPLVQIQAAVMLNKKNPKNQTSYGAIAEALKSEDELIVKKALKARNFFNGVNKYYTNTKYFFENLFMRVSVKTRIRIIKTLAMYLAPKNSDLAEEFFSAIALFYGIEQALPLLPACGEFFIYETVVEKRIILSRRMLKLLLRKNPDLVVRYLRLSKPNPADSTLKNFHPINIYDFSDILMALIKKQPESFVELYEMHEKRPPVMILSNKCANAFLKKGRKYVQRNPKLYIEIIPLKRINNNLMESIYQKLFPDDIKDFDTDKMLNYLKYYRVDRKLSFFLGSYEKVYKQSILCDTTKVTVDLMLILPIEERVKQATAKLQNQPRTNNLTECVASWECYLPTKESLPKIGEEIARATDLEHRMILSCRMIYTCIMNNDDQALLRVLSHLRKRHINEQPRFLYEMFKTLLKFCDLPQMSEEYWSILIDMIAHAHVKHDVLLGNDVGIKMIEAAIHHKILRNQSFDELINILIHSMCIRSTDYWNILRNNHENERMCLEACINIVSQNYNSDQSPWRGNRDKILYDLCVSIYNFNDMHVNNTSEAESMTIKDYPWLLQAVEATFSTFKDSNMYMVETLQHVLRSHEKDLYERFWPKTKTIAEVNTGEALRLLKRKPQEILAHWKEYLKACKDNWYKQHTKSFVKAIRWYKEIPIKFVEQCLRDLAEQREVICLDIISTLVYGETYSKIIIPLIPADNTLDIHRKEAKANYNLLQHIASGINLANPPVSLTVMNKLCQGDYLPVALKSLTNVCRRTNILDVMSFARMLSTQRVAVKKHGLRLMNMVAPLDQLLNFLQMQWNIEENHSIREMLFFVITKLFEDEPGPATWLLLSSVISTLVPHDDKASSKVISMVNSVTDEYLVEFIKLALKMIDKFEMFGLEEEKVAILTSILLNQIDATVCDLLPDNFIELLIERFLFHWNLNVSKSLSVFVVKALLLPAKENFDDRIYTFCNLLVSAMGIGWNNTHPKSSLYLPTNNGYHKFINMIVHTITFSEAEFRLIEELLSAFLTVHTPVVAPASYLRLLYSKMRIMSGSPGEFGKKLAEELHELTKVFTPYFVFFMADILWDMPIWNSFKDCNRDDAELGVIEGLLENESTMSALMAGKLYNYVNIKDQTRRQDRLMVKMVGLQIPAVRALVSDNMNRRCYDS